MSYYKVTLELARTEGFPEGSSKRGYHLVVPLDENDHLDEAAWRADKQKCTVHRFWEGEDDERGHLIHTRHRTWAFSYRPGEDDDEPLFHLENHRIRPGDYISIREQDGETLPFLIAEVRPISD